MWNLPEVRVYLKEFEGVTSEKEPKDYQEALTYVAEEIKMSDREQMVAIYLDSALQPLSYHVLSIGEIDRADANPACAFKTALLANASNILIMHNHPSGVVKPSQCDLDVTSRYREIGKLIGVELLDHWIVGPNNHLLSIRDNHPEIFGERKEDAA